jgi:hypothetical protein
LLSNAAWYRYAAFESILRNYPKRTDIWSVYIDQEIKQGDPVGLFYKSNPVVDR